MVIYHPFVDIYKGEPYYGTDQSDDAHGKDSTVTLTKDDATLTANSDDWDSADVAAGDMIMFDYSTSRIPYFVSSVTDGQNLEMVCEWPNTTASGVSYTIDNSDGSDNWFLRIYPILKQHSGKSSPVTIPIPFESQTSAMPMQNTEVKYHIDGYVYLDSCTKSGVDTPQELFDAIEELSNYNGILGFKWYNQNLSGGASEGVVINEWTIKDKLPARSFGTDKWKRLIQIDVTVCEEL